MIEVSVYVSSGLHDESRQKVKEDGASSKRMFLTSENMVLIAVLLHQKTDL